ncbi:restriction endonuclease [Parafrankia soli]|uniref:restriction endonuclease n=1 Tax=Parafrankia soli TaxID=2599596 RepID=UPI0012FFAA90|nr:restriction endonuclease [Parafrankia soli]
MRTVTRPRPERHSCGMAERRETRGHKKISGDAYQALRSALALSYWFKPSLEKHLRASLRDHPEILSGIDFKAAKRDVADIVVDRLIDGELRYQDLTVSLMVEFANKESFTEIERHEDSDKWLPLAKGAIAELKRHTVFYEDSLRDRERLAESERTQYQDRTAAQIRFSDELAALKARFIEMTQMEDPHGRGFKFEQFLNDLFHLFDLSPRLGYSLETEQIDGAFTFDTDNYIVEAKWTREPVSAQQAAAFASKVDFKGRNALGLIVSVNGLTAAARRKYEVSSPFITIDGSDLFFIFEGHGSPAELLRRKKRNVDETGNCYFPAAQIIG